MEHYHFVYKYVIYLSSRVTEIQFFIFGWNFKETQNRPMIVQDFHFRKWRWCTVYT